MTDLTTTFMRVPELHMAGAVMVTVLPITYDALAVADGAYERFLLLKGTAQYTSFNAKAFIGSRDFEDENGQAFQ